MARDKWNALPADVRKVIDEVGNDIVARGCAATDSMEATDIEKIKAAGVTMQPLPPADSKQLQSLMAEVSKEWAAGLDQRGRKGSEVLKAFQDALAK